QLIGPVVLNQDLRTLPYIPPGEEDEAERLTPYRHPRTGPPKAEPSSPWLYSLLRGLFRPTPKMPPPLLTFDGINVTQAGCEFCPLPDTNGDVGPNHYLQAVNEAFQVFDKNGNTLSGPTTYNSFFA